MLQELLAWQALGAQAHQVRVFYLRIDQRPAAAMQLGGERCQCNLGAATGATEHAFAEEHLADRNPIDAAYQTRAVEHFH